MGSGGKSGGAARAGGGAGRGVGTRMPGKSQAAISAELNAAAEKLLEITEYLDGTAKREYQNLQDAFTGADNGAPATRVAGRVMATPAQQSAMHRAGPPQSLYDVSASERRSANASANRIMNKLSNKAKAGARDVVDSLNRANTPADAIKVYNIALALEDSNYHAPAALYYNRAALLVASRGK